jgi:hypothetical protein
MSSKEPMLLTHYTRNCVGVMYLHFTYSEVEYAIGTVKPRYPMPTNILYENVGTSKLPIPAFFTTKAIEVA